MLPLREVIEVPEYHQGVVVVEPTDDTVIRHRPGFLLFQVNAETLIELNQRSSAHSMDRSTTETCFQDFVG